MKHTYRVALVGAGGISQAHLRAVQSVPCAEVTAVVDIDNDRARALARAAGGADIHESVAGLVAAKGCDVAHVLVPPDAHRRAAEPLLRAGIHVLCEKPLATTTADCEALLRAAEAGGACLAVNQTMTYHPTFRALERVIASNELGPLHHLVCVWNAPFSLLRTRQFHHWVFRSPENVVLEQAIHPLSMVAWLAGKPESARALASDVSRPAPGALLHDTWQVSMRLEKATAQLFYSAGQSFEVRQLTAVCADGVLDADLLAARIVVRDRSHLSAPYDLLRSGLSQAAHIAATSVSCFAATVAGSLLLAPRFEPDTAAMMDSVAAFYDGLPLRKPHMSGRFGADLVAACEQITREVSRGAAAAAPAPRAVAAASGDGPCDVAILGGGGFIGRHTARALAREGLSVRVVVRDPAAASHLAGAPGIEVVKGDASRPEDVERVARRAKAIIDMVLPRAEGSGQDEQMVAIARGVAESCLRHGVRKLIYLSSIESLFLGDDDETITGATPPDPRSGEREPYARGKASSERLLLSMHATAGLPVCIVRPAIVVGEGGRACHSGVGRWVNEQHCVGYYNGRNPLPFVLVDDVADAICRALRTERATGRTYNLVGDVRLTAREYVAELRRITGRPIQFHPAPAPEVTYAAGLCVTALKRFAGRSLDLPYLGDIKHLRMLAQFDCEDVHRDLGWTPVSDRAEFVRRGIEVHATELARARGAAVPRVATVGPRA